MAETLKIFIAQAGEVVYQLVAAQQLGKAVQDDIELLEQFVPDDFREGSSLILASPEANLGKLVWSPYVFDAPPSREALRTVLQDLAERLAFFIASELLRDEIVQQIEQGPAITGIPVPGSDGVQ